MSWTCYGPFSEKTVNGSGRTVINVANGNRDDHYGVLHLAALAVGMAPDGYAETGKQPQSGLANLRTYLKEHPPNRLHHPSDDRLVFENAIDGVATNDDRAE